MKKNFLVFLSVLILISVNMSVFAKTVADPELAEAIKLYKAQNYSECYSKLSAIVEKDSPSALAYYYMAITATQLGKKGEAIQNYEKAILLSPENNNISRFSQKGKRCLETPDRCEESLFTSAEDEFIINQRHLKFSDVVKNEYEKLKIDNIRREINRNGDIDPQKFKEYKDFSSMNFDSVPTNDEIVAALKVLQRAGLSNMIGMNPSSMLNDLNNSNAFYGLMNNSSLSPQIIQSMLTTNMMQGF